MEAPRLEEILAQIKSRASVNPGEIPPAERLQSAALYIALSRVMLMVEFAEKPRMRILFEDMLHAVCMLLVDDIERRKELMKLVDGYTKVAARDVRDVFQRRCKDDDTER